MASKLKATASNVSDYGNGGMNLSNMSAAAAETSTASTSGTAASRKKSDLSGRKQSAASIAEAQVIIQRSHRLVFFIHLVNLKNLVLF